MVGSVDPVAPLGELIAGVIAETTTIRSAETKVDERTRARSGRQLFIVTCRALHVLSGPSVRCALLQLGLPSGKFLWLGAVDQVSS